MEKTVTDFGGRNQWARIGYVWSLADRSDVKGETGDIIGKIKVSKGEKVLIYVDIVWRPQATLARRYNEFDQPIEFRPSISTIRAPPTKIEIVRDLDDSFDKLAV
jgi:hypothetical protein